MEEFIHKVCTLRFCNSGYPSLCTCTYIFSTSVRIVFFKEVMAGISFANYYQPKNHKHCCKTSLFKFTEEMGMDKFGCLSSLLYFISVLWLTWANNLWHTYAYSWTFPSPYKSQYGFSWTTPLTLLPSSSQNFTRLKIKFNQEFILSKFSSIKFKFTWAKVRTQIRLWIKMMLHYFKILYRMRNKFKYIQ